AEARLTNYRKFYPPESVDMLDRVVAPALARGEDWEGILDAFDAKGRRFPLWERASTIQDSDGTMLYAFGFMQDITEQRRNHAALQRSEAKLKLAHSIAKLGYWNWEVERDLAEWSDEVYRIFNARRKVPSYEFARSFVHPADLARWEREIAHAVADQRPFAIEYRAVRTDGETIWVRNETLSVFDGEGRFIGYEGTVQDITERKEIEIALIESEEKYRALVESAIDHIFIIDLDGNYIMSNAQLLTHNLNKGHSLIGLNQRDIHPADIADIYQEKLHHVMATGKAVTFEHPLIVDGVLFHHLDTLYPLIKDGGIWMIGGICRDITEWVRAKESLLKSRQELRELYRHMESVRERERKDIAMKVHDDLGQALTALKMDLFSLRERLVEANPMVTERIESMSTLIDQTINSVQRISSTLRPSILDHLGIVGALEWQIEEFKKRYGIRCALKVEPEEIILDIERSTCLFRILQELQTNVIRHAHATKVMVGLVKTDSEILLTVEDNGRGINMDQILNPESFGIHGIRERLLGLNGKADFYARPGKGTKVKVRIPIDGKGQVT
ncbi:MAG: PAS domain S-box protein, partial [Syntrophaceae bacterium]|nr:PAS domain S-box protein [Syntrophaceae bacterium]